MSSAAEGVYGASMAANSLSNSSISPTANADHSNEQWLLKLLIEAGLKGDRTELLTLAERFQHQPHTLRLIAAYLKRWYAGRLNGLDIISGFADCADDEALARVLNAFENKLNGASDLTLLYLLSLSDRPVPQQHMQSAFHSTLMERWLTKRDDYVRFLGPLGRLNTEHWHWVVENLRRLQLLEQPVSGQHDLLFVEEPIRQYFRRKLRERNPGVFEQATQDMDKLFEDNVVEFRQRYQSAPEIKTWLSPELRAELEEEKPDPYAALWKSEELDTVQSQLDALRGSLGSLKQRSEKLAEQLRVNSQQDNLAGQQKESGIKSKTATESTVARKHEKLPPNAKQSALTAGQDTA